MTIDKPITSNYSSIERQSYTQHSFGSLKHGQILNAVALSNSHHGHVRLKIGNSIVTAATHIALQQNTQLRLEVVQTQPRLLLRLTPSTANQLGLNPVHDALRPGCVNHGDTVIRRDQRA